MSEHNPEHRRIRDLLGPSVLGALTPEEELEVGEHLEQCDQCRSEEADIRQAHEYMSDLASVIEAPPPELKSRAVNHPRRSGRSLVSLAAAAVLLVLVGLVAAYSAGVFTPATATASLGPTQLAPGAGGELKLENSDPNARAILTVWNLPRLKDGEYYELWCGKGGGRVSAGTFTVDEKGRRTLYMSVPAKAVGEYERVGITREKFPREPRLDSTKVVLSGELNET